MSAFILLSLVEAIFMIIYVRQSRDVAGGVLEYDFLFSWLIGH
jgi:hypothetical protein